MDLSCTWLEGAVRSEGLHGYTILTKILDWFLLCSMMSRSWHVHGTELQRIHSHEPHFGLQVT